MSTIAQQLNVQEFPFEIKDSKGRKIYFEDSNKSWSKYEYDSQDHVIRFENSTGYWSKREYDFNDNVIYQEKSNGEIFDKR